MENKTIYSKTARGMREAANKTKDLPRNLRNVLKAIDGKSTFQDLLKTLDGFSPTSLQQAISTLIAEDYIRKLEALSPLPVPPSSSQKLSPKQPAVASDADLDFTSLANDPDQSIVNAAEMAEAKARQEAEVRRRAAEEQARREAEERLRREAEEDRLRKEAKRLRLEAEAKAKLATEEKARKEAEKRQCREAEAKVKQEAEAETRRKAAEEQARREAEERLRRQAEAQAKQEAEEERLHKEANRLQLEAEAKAKQEAQKFTDQEDAARHAAENTFATSIPSGVADIPVSRSRATRYWGRILAQVVLFAIVAGAVIVHFIPFDERLSAFEKSATTQFRQPVKAKALNFWLFPTPHWRLQDVTVGDRGQIRIPLVKARTSISALFGAQAPIAALDMESAQLDAEGIAWVLLGKAQANDLGFARITAKDVKVRAPFGALPTFDADATVDANGNWQKLMLQAQGQKFSAELNASGNGTSVKLSAAAYTLPLSLNSVEPVKPVGLTLRNFSLVGMLSDKVFAASEFSGETNDGYITGKARLGWASGWTLNGEAKARLLDTAVMFPALSERGVLSGNGSFAMQGADPSALMHSARAEGRFLVERGTLHGIDLGRVLRGVGGGGSTLYSTFDGKFAYSDGKTQLRNVKLVADIMSASGNVDVTADRQINGRFALELKSASITERSTVSVVGTLDSPQFRR